MDVAPLRLSYDLNSSIENLINVFVICGNLKFLTNCCQIKPIAALHATALSRIRVAGQVFMCSRK
jgi:hypothetical protein